MANTAVLSDNLLTQVVSSPTRGDNILDLALVGDVDSVLDCTVHENFSTSDHNMIELVLNCPVPRIESCPRKVYLYSKGNFEEMDQEIMSIDWSSKLGSRNINENFERFKTIYESLIETYVPHNDQARRKKQTSLDEI